MLELDPRNRGQEGTIDPQQIRDIYKNILDLQGDHAAVFRQSVLAYAPGAGPVKQVVYGERNFQYVEGGETKTFVLPKMSYIGYTDRELGWIDAFYGGLVRRLETGDVEFINSEPVKELANKGGDAREVFSLRAPDNVEGAASGRFKGIGPVYGQDGDTEHETLIISEDLHDLEAAQNASFRRPRARAEFVSRVVHEMLHRNWTHVTYSYDENQSVVENLRNGFDVEDLRALDKVYGETRNLLRSLDGTGLSSSELQKVWRDGTEAALTDALNWRTKRLYLKTRDALRSSDVDFSPEDLRLLDREGIVKLKDYPPDCDTAEERAVYRSKEENYELDTRFIRNLPRHMQEEIAQVSYSAVGEGAPTSIGEAVDVALVFARSFFAQFSSEIGQVFGSTLGRQLARGQNQSVQIGASTVLGVVGENLGELIEWRLRGADTDASAVLAFKDIRDDLKRAGTGAISSFLTAELFESLGAEGTLADLGQSVFSMGLTEVIRNISAIAAGTKTIPEVLQGIELVNIGNVIGGYIGTRLAADLMEFDTIGGQIGASVGSAIGTIVGTAAAMDGALMGMKLGSFAGPVGALIGAFVGYILGGLIGSLFGGTPKSGADVAWDGEKFSVMRVWSKNGGSKDAARSVATTVAETVNGVIGATGSKLLDPAQIRIGGYGMRDKDFVYWATGGDGARQQTFKTRNSTELVNHGAAIAIYDLLPRLIGGDVYVKRAVAATLAHAGGNPASNYGGAAGSFDINVLLGNISTAQDFAGYLANSKQIDVLIAAQPDSAFTAGWSITFARVMELGLLKRSTVDWAGGWNAFMDERADRTLDGVGFTAAAMEFTIDNANRERLFVFFGGEGEVLAVAGDTIDAGRKDLIVGTSQADTIIVSLDRIAVTSGLTINAAAASGAAYVIPVAATIEGGAGNDLIVGGDLGNDLWGGDDNDTLVGGKLDDWLFGQAGNDRLFAGAANYQFVDGDASAMAAALNTISNGDLLDGGDGDDVLYGSLGSDWLRGGAGSDTIYGGAGGDIIDGGAGDDSSPDGTPRLFGGAGTDQYVFGYGSGIDGIFDEADNAEPGSSGQDSIHTRVQQIANGSLARNWAGGGDYEVDGSVRGGEDAISFGIGIGLRDLILQRSGQDLMIRLTYEDPQTGVRNPTGDQLVITDWFESSRRVEWLRFADGEEVRIGDITSFIAGTSSADIIIGTNEADFMYGDEGNDLMYGLAGDDFGFGGGGRDVVAGDGDNDWVAGGRDDDKVMGGAGNDTAFGDGGNDEVYGGLGSDIVVGGRGNDHVVGGAGNDIFRYQRGDGRDVLIDEYVNNWEVVWTASGYTNGYVLDTSTGVVSKNGTVVFDGAQWMGLYDYDEPTRTFRRHLGTVNGAIAANSGTDYLEFGVGINIQDLIFRQTGNDIEIAILSEEDDALAFDEVADRITIRDWYVAGRTIENFVFAATGRHDVLAWNLQGRTDGADTMNGAAGSDWFTGGGGDDTINGNGGNDILSGNSGADIVRGGAGNDVLYGGEGNDVLDGGAGSDTLVGGAGIDIASYATATGAGVGIRAFLDAAHTNTRDGLGDTFTAVEGIEGTSGADVLGGDAGQNTLRGIAGNDTMYGGAGDDTYEININHGVDIIQDAPFATEVITNVDGTLNTELFTAAWINTTVEGDDEIGYTWYYQLIVTRNGSGEEVYRSGEYDFAYPYSMGEVPPASDWPSTGWLAGTGTATSPTFTNNGSQVVREVFQNANGGNDTVEFGAEISLSDLTFQRVNGGADLQITYRNGHSVTIRGQNDSNRAVESLLLNDGLSVDLTRLVLAGQGATGDNDFVAGDANANTLQGLAGDDVLSGANGNDTLYGGDGDDVLEGGEGADTLDGGHDSVSAGLNPGTTDQTRPFGDTIRYVRSLAAVQIDLAARTAAGGQAAGDIITAVNGVSTIENVVGSDLFGDTLRGDARANRLSGLGGSDVLEGGGGADVLVGGLGDDTLRGGDGEDNLAGDEGVDTLEGGAAKDLLAGGAGGDFLFGDAGEDVLSGGDGGDVIHGGDDDDRLGGDAGEDTLYGDLGADQLAGGAGTDYLYGGAGNDVLSGEAGSDHLFGEAGNDTYVFDANSGADVIVDAEGMNRILISGVGNDRVWITRSGSDLRIAVIGGTTSITVQNYYGSDTPTRVREIALDGHSLFVAYSEPLIALMTQWTEANGGTTPSSLPTDFSAYLGGYWHSGGRAAPTVDNRTVSTDEDTALSGSVIATDHDENIVSYAIEAAADRGTVTIDAATGHWTYTPLANLHGRDTFAIVVTDAHNNRAVQTITVDVVSVNDAPSDIAFTGTTQIEERDRPPAGTLLTPIVLGTLSATDVDFPDEGDFDDHVFSVADSRFEIVDGTTLRLRAGAALDFEATPTVSVQITVTDRNGAGLSFTREFTFTVIDRDDYLYGTPSNDTLTGQAGRNLLFGYAGSDILIGANANDDLDGGDGLDQLFGHGGNDLLLGGLGDDTLEGGAGLDVLHGGDGFDTLRGQDGDDRLFGDGGNDILEGGSGDDLLEGGEHDDQLYGGDGGDELRGGDGNDTMVGGAGGDTFVGGAGFDTVSYESATAGVTVNVTTTAGSTGEAAGDVFQDSIERIIGTSFDDVITGNTHSERIEGGAGNDTIYGGAGNDTLLGGFGNDILDAQAGNDTLDGGVGNDVLIGGDHSDTYLMDVNSGADDIYNYDPSGSDVDVIGYQNITREQLWFERSGNDMIVSVIGTSVRTTIRDWYLVSTSNDRANYKVDFIIASDRFSETIDVEALVALMADYTRPTTQAQFDELRSTPSFQDTWYRAWRLNNPPVVPTIPDQTINEDGTFTLTINIGDDITPAAGVAVVVRAVRPNDHTIDDSSIVNSPTISPADGSGNRTLTVTPRPNASGQVAILITATDAGGLETSRVFTLNVVPVADAPVITVAQAATPAAPLTQPTLDSGSWAINVQAALVDQDGSETLEIRIANVPTGISFTAGTNLGGGTWSFLPQELPGLRIQGPSDWAQDLALSITAISRETLTGQTATSEATPLNIVINARPTDLWADRNLAFNENTAAGTGLAWFLRSDGDNGDTATYELLNNAGGRFTLRSDGLLSTGNTILDYETGASHTISVRITDSGGLSRVEDFMVAVINVNEAPTNIWADRTLSFAETIGTSTGIAWFGASDPENNITSYSLVNDAGGRFSMRADGLLSTGTTPLNYEAATGHWITVRASDVGGLYRDQNFWVEVQNVNEAPTINSSAFAVFEGTHGGPGSYLMTTGGGYALVTGSDQEGATLSYQLVGGDTNVISIDTAGYLHVQGVLDYETRPTYSVLARAWDGGAIGQGNYSDRWITINTQNVQEAPTISWSGTAQASGTNRAWTYAGTVSGWDPDGGSTTIEIGSVFSLASVAGQDAMGEPYFYEYWNDDTSVSPQVVSIDASGNVYLKYGYYYTGGGWTFERGYDALIHLNLRVRDSSGATSQIIGVTVSFYGGPAEVGNAWAPPTFTAPVVLDLDGDGIELVSFSESSVHFRMKDGAAATRTGWIGADDAVLALDRNGDGAITQGSEISFVGDLAGAKSDLEGLAAFDTDNDGSFDSGDARFGEFRVWQDANQDGVSQSEELKSLADHGITAISLDRALTGRTTDRATDNVITATSQFTRSDGTVGLVGDVVLASEDTSFQIIQQPNVPPSPVGADGQPIDQIDRSANNGAKPERARQGDVSAPDLPEMLGNDSEFSRAVAASEQEREQDAAARRRPWRWADLENLSAADTAEAEDGYAGASAMRAGALHASLDSVVRRRLQMIEAMAAFAPEGASMLELQPRRKVDGRTLELLTSVPEIRVM